MARRIVIAGNWKMHKTLVEARELMTGIRAGIEALGPGAAGGACAAGTVCAVGGGSAAGGGGLADLDIVVFPPATLLFPMAKAIAGTPIRMGAQNAHFEPQGAFTGEISARQVADTGCTLLLVGHSERRHVFGETGDMLARKVRAGLDARLTVVYCVGETLAERQAGKTQTVVEGHLAEALASDLDWGRLVIAYEPVWAIGTGQTATPQQAQEVHALIRKWLAARVSAKVSAETRLLYGGSVKPDNAAGLLAQPDIDGALVGGACLSAKDFSAIIAAGLAAGRA
ncbi:MAG: triose-phosphate isomerase [Phycisphaerales bacterium]|nr:triose-phosphate isomerase [Phycisphaerales bacterium]